MKSGLRTDSYPVCQRFGLGYSTLLGARAKKGIERPRSTLYRRNDTRPVCALSIEPRSRRVKCLCRAPAPVALCGREDMVELRADADLRSWSGWRGLLAGSIARAPGTHRLVRRSRPRTRA